MPKISDVQQEQRRGRILDAAELCFARHGFHRTTMQDISREAGVSAGGIYLYFASKEALIEGISARIRARVLTSFERLSADADFLRGMWSVVQECILDQPEHEARLWLEIGAESTRNPAVAATMARCDAQIFAALGGYLEEACLRGRIAPQAPVEQVVAVMSVIADGLFLRRALDPSIDLRPLAQAAFEVVSAMVRPQAKAEKELQP